jgi:hypothetical protein
MRLRSYGRLNVQVAALCEATGKSNPLQGFDYELASESEIRTLAALHVFRRRLGKGSYENREGNGGVTIHVGSVRAACELAVDQSFIKRDGIGPASRMGRVSCDLNGIFMTVMVIF